MDADDIADIFSAFGPVTVRRMFGGLGLYADGVMFALAGFGEIYLKTDDALARQLQSEGSRPFAYEGKGRVISLGYWSLPDGRIDDPEAIAEIAREALAVAQRAAAAKRRKPAKPAVVRGKVRQPLRPR